MGFRQTVRPDTVRYAAQADRLHRDCHRQPLHSCRRGTRQVSRRLARDQPSSPRSRDDRCAQGVRPVHSNTRRRRTTFRHSTHSARSSSPPDPTPSNALCTAWSPTDRTQPVPASLCGIPRSPGLGLVRRATGRGRMARTMSDCRGCGDVMSGWRGAGMGRAWWCRRQISLSEDWRWCRIIWMRCSRQRWRRSC